VLCAFAGVREMCFDSKMSVLQHSHCTGENIQVNRPKQSSFQADRCENLHRCAIAQEIAT
jgi:hypothetical protein